MDRGAMAEAVGVESLALQRRDLQGCPAQPLCRITRTLTLGAGNALRYISYVSGPASERGAFGAMKPSPDATRSWSYGSAFLLTLGILLTAFAPASSSATR